MRFLFYISGHGFGHATRMAALAARIQQDFTQSKICVRSLAPKELFGFLPASVLDYSRIQLDIGVVERDFFSQDIRETVKENELFYKALPQLVSREKEFVARNGIDVIVSDIPPLASMIGHESSVPTVAISNFTWDYIYEEYTPSQNLFADLVSRMREMYSRTSLMLRLPFNHEMKSFPLVRDVPLLVRGITRTKSQVREKLGIDRLDDRPIILIALRMKNVLPDEAVLRITKLSQFRFIVPAGVPQYGAENLIALSESWAHWDFPDVLNAADLVVSKVGYGIVSECIAYHTPLLHVPRFNFAEYELLKAGLGKYIPSCEIEAQDFLDGNWQDYITLILKQKDVLSSMPCNGAEIAVKEIKSLCNYDQRDPP